jgi:hypothetical protein
MNQFLTSTLLSILSKFETNGIEIQRSHLFQAKTILKQNLYAKSVDLSTINKYDSL